jgi:hypothetical protein
MATLSRGCCSLLSAASLWLLLTGPARSVDYVVDGWKLGANIKSGSLQAFSCTPAAAYDQLTACIRTQPTSLGSLAGTLMHNENGAVVFLKVRVAPVKISKDQIEKEIVQLSGELGGKPSSVNWVDGRPDGGRSVIAQWGQIKLERVGDAFDEAVASGKYPAMDALVDPLGDPQQSGQSSIEVDRILGGTGYIYTASFDKNGRGHRQYVAVNGNEVAMRQYEADLRALLANDQADAADFSLWPKVADYTRRLARGVTPKLANEALDKAFEKIPSKKYKSHAFAYLPGGAIQHLTIHQHWDIDIYGPKTDTPAIRSSIQSYLASKPTDPFTELLYYVTADYEQAARFNPKSPLADVMHYAAGFRLLGPVLHDAIQTAKARTGAKLDEPPEIFRKINLLITEQYLLDNKPLSALVPNFAARVAPARAHLEEVLHYPTVSHADDAAFILGWLTLHEGKPYEQALPYFAKAMATGDGDYRDPGAMGRVLRILYQLSTHDKFAVVDRDAAFARQPALAYVAARSAYREFDYAATMAAATRYLKGMGIDLGALPVTTDQERIDKFLRIDDPDQPQNQTQNQTQNPSLDPEQNPFLDDNPLTGGNAPANLREIPYILRASAELAQYEKYLQGIAGQRPEDVIKSARTIVIKYSKLLDGDDNRSREEKDRKPGLPDFSHKDLRQAIHLIDVTLAATKSPPYAKLREWLYYRKARVAAVFAPDIMPDIYAAMSAEFPSSNLLDDVLAEQIFAQGVIKTDLNGARATFNKLVSTYPKGNAVDNAYSSMAIILRCNRQLQEADKMNREIIRRFGMTRHAAYAKQRMADPKACGAQAYSKD